MKTSISVSTQLKIRNCLRGENTQLKRELTEVKLELSDVQQYSRRKITVDIQGVPEVKSETVFEVVKFVRRGDCDELLRLAKVKRGYSASELGAGSSDSKIFVNPSLSKSYRELLYYAKCAAREGRVRFAWYSNGKVLVRRKDGEPAIHITSRLQLQDLRRGEQR